MLCLGCSSVAGDIRGKKVASFSSNIDRAMKSETVPPFHFNELSSLNEAARARALVFSWDAPGGKRTDGM
jgi:hypothetical protein